MKKENGSALWIPAFAGMTIFSFEFLDAVIPAKAGIQKVATVFQRTESITIPSREG